MLDGLGGMVVKESLLLEWRVVTEQKVSLGIEKFFRKLGVTVEEYSATLVPRMHADNTV